MFGLLRSRGVQAVSRTCVASAGAVWPSAVNIAAVGRKRSAAFGTRTTSSRAAISMLTFAVMPGLSFSAAIRDVDDHAVGRHVLHDARLQPDLRDRAGEALVRVGVHLEGDPLRRAESGRCRTRRCSR